MTQTAPIVELITIGREILDGRVIDTNSVFMAEKLRERGLIPRYAQRVDDDMARILEAFKIAASRSHIMLVTGGLGPTSDDITAEALGQFLGEKVELNSVALEHLSARLALLNRPLTDTQKKQALLPPSAFVLANPEGTAVGFGANLKTPHAQQWFFMPGVPREMKRMLLEQVFPQLPIVTSYLTHTWATHFTAEATLQENLTAIEKRLPPGFEVTYRTRFPENHVGLHGNAETPERQKQFALFCSEITEALKSDCFWHGDGNVVPLENIVFEKLVAQKALLTTVESCTGGLISHRMTDISGSSGVFWGAHVPYDNSAKEALGVPSETIQKFGAVSKPVAVSLAEEGLKKLKALAQKRGFAGPLYCLSTTGIAGPTGGTAEKPVGLCHVALAQSEGPTLHEEVRGRAALDRGLLKTFFSQKALDLLRRSF